MQLAIETFDNSKGGNSFYKAVTHPLAARRAAPLLQRLGEARRLAIYDPLGFAGGFDAIHGLARLKPAGVFVQDVTQVGRPRLGSRAQP
ncbi:MAG: hypothetical protein JO255_05910, partial [Alphaproteobacteria bacterium]|nr:hypothetical protein [Alphaproteobacteria bacterium]